MLQLPQGHRSVSSPRGSCAKVTEHARGSQARLMAPKEQQSPATLLAQLGTGLPLAALQCTLPAPNTPQAHRKHPQRQGPSAPFHRSPRSGQEQHPLPGGEKIEPRVQQRGQGTGFGTIPGRCCSHPGSAESPWVPLPRLSPQCGAGRSRLRHHRLQPPASAALAIYTQPGRRAPIARQP